MSIIKQLQIFIKKFAYEFKEFWLSGGRQICLGLLCITGVVILLRTAGIDSGFATRKASEWSRTVMNQNPTVVLCGSSQNWDGFVNCSVKVPFHSVIALQCPYSINSDNCCHLTTNDN